MNKDQFHMWKDGVVKHNSLLKSFVSDRKELKRLIEEHLSKYFEWDEIEYDNEFKKITLTLDPDTVLKSDKLRELDIDYSIIGGFDFIIVKIYPFGFFDEKGDD